MSFYPTDRATVYAVLVDFIKPPPGFSAVSRIASDTVISSQTEETLYTIPANKRVTIHSIFAGGEASVSGSRVEFCYRPLGNSANDELFSIPFYVSGSNFSRQVNAVYTGDASGTDEIVLRRVNLGGGLLHISGEWHGYVED